MVNNLGGRRTGHRIYEGSEQLCKSRGRGNEKIFLDSTGFLLRCNHAQKLECYKDNVSMLAHGTRKGYLTGRYRREERERGEKGTQLLLEALVNLDRALLTWTR